MPNIPTAEEILPPGEYTCEITAVRYTRYEPARGGAVEALSYKLTFTNGPFKNVSIVLSRRIAVLTPTAGVIFTDQL